MKETIRTLCLILALFGARGEQLPNRGQCILFQGVHEVFHSSEIIFGIMVLKRENDFRKFVSSLCGNMVH